MTRQIGETNTIRFSAHKASSPAFQKLYSEGMALVEETATYLDGQGRAEAKTLDRGVATLYAAESMRLTTRLMQLASWLLLQRALNSGEMTRDQVISEKSKIRLDTHSAQRDIAGWTELPESFRDLVRRSLRLQSEVQRMDMEVFGNPVFDPDDMTPVENPVQNRINLLKTAFGA